MVHEEAEILHDRLRLFVDDQALQLAHCKAARGAALWGGLHPINQLGDGLFEIVLIAVRRGRS
jgi:hypothetical protein